MENVFFHLLLVTHLDSKFKNICILYGLTQFYYGLEALGHSVEPFLKTCPGLLSEMFGGELLKVFSVCQS